jgi:hypothetical protein
MMSSDWSRQYLDRARQVTSPFSEPAKGVELSSERRIVIREYVART